MPNKRTTPELAKGTVGLVGVGLMGGIIAERLSLGGLEVIGFDRKSLKSNHVKLCRNLSEVFQPCATIVLSLPTSLEVKQVVEEAGEFLKPGIHSIIDTTTGDPEQVLELHQILGSRRIEYLEATIAGSSKQLQQGEATIFLGGDESVIHKHRSLINLLSQHNFLVGSMGRASRFKLVHNLILGLNRAVLAEGLAFAESLGFDPSGVIELLRQTAAYSTVMDTKGERMAHGDYTVPDARLSQHLKDVRLILDQALLHGAKTPLSDLHQCLLEEAEAQGLGAVDNSSIIEVFRNSKGKNHD